MKTGIIGLGKMGGALLRGMLKSGAVAPQDVWVYDHHKENMAALQAEHPGVHEAESEEAAADAVEALVLAVKPHAVLPLISALSEGDRELPLLISIAAAVTLDEMEERACDGTRIVRAMPNTPALLGEGMTSVAFSEDSYEDEEKEAVLQIFR